MFYGGGSVVVSIDAGGSVLATFFLFCITECPFEFCNHFDDKKRAGCFNLIVFLTSCDC